MNFSEWLKKRNIDLDVLTADLTEPTRTDGKESDEGATSTGDVANFARPIGGSSEIEENPPVDGMPKKNLRKFPPEVTKLNLNLKAEKDNIKVKKTKAPKGVRPMRNDIPGLQ